MNSSVYLNRHLQLRQFQDLGLLFLSQKGQKTLCYQYNFAVKMGCCYDDKAVSKNKQRSKRIPGFKTLKMINTTSTTSESQLRNHIYDIFAKYDLNKSGMLQRHQVKYMMMEMARQRNEAVTQKEIQIYVNKFMAKADVQQNGKISREEFYQYYKKK